MSIVQFHDLDAEAPRFPRPAASMQPVWPSIAIGGRGFGGWSSRFSGPGCRWAAGGRYALAHALCAADVTSADTVLLPAFHCGSMVEPVLWLGANVNFYRMSGDLSPEPTELQRLLKTGARAMVLPHYFGFPQPVREIRQLCDDSGVALIEDCAHALVGNFGGRPPGSFGHFAVASSRKFCPGPDGGIACSNVNTTRWPVSVRPGARRQTRALYHLGTGMLRHASALLQPSPGRLAEKAQPVPAPRDNHVSVPSNARSSSGWRWFSEEHASVGATAVAKLLFWATDWQRVAEARRKNYLMFQRASRQLRSAAPLHAELPDGVAPYAFPLVLSDPARDFRRLKHLRVPIGRWDEQAVSGCAVSRSYRTSLIQLPCHENLDDRAVAWMCGVLSEILS